jgi:hypothetical protein
MCGRMGTYEDVVPMCIHRRVERIDRCIAEIVAALEAGGCEPRASCCGHGGQCGSVLLRDGRTLLIFPSQEAASGAERQSMTDERLAHFDDDVDWAREERARRKG